MPCRAIAPSASARLREIRQQQYGRVSPRVFGAPDHFAGRQYVRQLTYSHGDVIPMTIHPIDPKNQGLAGMPTPALMASCVALLTIPYFLILRMEPDTWRWLGKEDGPIEWISVACFAIAFSATLYAALRCHRGRFFGKETRSNVWLYLLAAFFFVCGGEEISWGQRIFGWSTPELWRSINAQEETNLHNIWLFQGKKPDGSQMSFFELLFNTNRILQTFSMLYGVIIPVADQISLRANQLIVWLGIPVPPLKIGAMFLVSYIAFRVAVGTVGSDAPIIRPLNELKETNAAFLFALIALYFASNAFAGRLTPRPS